jgi:hypothetical protein
VRGGLELSGRWQTFRTIFTILAGALVLWMGVRQDNAAMMTVGAGLVGFSPASKGP